MSIRPVASGLLLIVLGPAMNLLTGCGEEAGGDEPDGGIATDGAMVADAPITDGGPMVDAPAEPDAGSEPDAGPPEEPCEEPGEMRVIPCGSCGLASQRCGDDGVWEPAGTCLGEGECAPGSIETEATPYCGERSRICDSECAWRDWTETVPATGECNAGETRMDEADCGSGGQREQTCSDSCEWVNSGPCVDLCGGTARTTPADAAEICIPAGPFIRGGPRYAATPVGEVRLSAYYIDKYPVTNERYAACVSAGACELPEYEPWHTDPARARHPVQSLSPAHAAAFCAWDGGRRLPTEAEWEKAARGPSPREQFFLWDDPDYDCSLLNSGLCGYTQSDQVIPDAVDALPGTRSYYGTEMMIGGGLEFVSDYWSTSYYSDPSSYDDPPGPASGASGVTRGHPRRYEPLIGDPDETVFSVFYRRSTSLTGTVPAGVIRCARTP